MRLILHGEVARGRGVRSTPQGRPSSAMQAPCNQSSTASTGLGGRWNWNSSAGFSRDSQGQRAGVLQPRHAGKGARTDAAREEHGYSLRTLQKPNAGNNYRNFRKLFPKGEAMDFLTQKKVDLAMVAHEHHAQGGTVGHGCHQDVRPERYGTDVPGAGA